MTLGVSWREAFACRDADPDLFFPIKAASRQTEKSETDLPFLPVQTECLAWALENGVTDGVRGGTTSDERRIIWSRSRKQRIGES